MLREHLGPIQELWSIVLDRKIEAVINEDNESTITVINTGHSPQLRYLPKHHRISLGLVHELCQQDDIVLQPIGNDTQKGDILTKGLQRPKHDPAMNMVGVYPVVWIKSQHSYLKTWHFYSSTEHNRTVKSVQDFPREAGLLFPFKTSALSTAIESVLDKN